MIYVKYFLYLVSGIFDNKIDINIPKDINFNRRDNFQLKNQNEQVQKNLLNNNNENYQDKNKKQEYKKQEQIKKPQKVQNLDLENINLSTCK